MEAKLEFELVANTESLLDQATALLPKAVFTNDLVANLAPAESAPPPGEFNSVILPAAITGIGFTVGVPLIEEAVQPLAAVTAVSV